MLSNYKKFGGGGRYIRLTNPLQKRQKGGCYQKIEVASSIVVAERQVAAY